MSHRQRNTHIAYLFEEVGTGEFNRDGSERTDWEEYTSFGVRLTDVGGSFTQTISGERDVETPILSGPGWLIDEGLDEGQRLALKGAGLQHGSGGYSSDYGENYGELDPADGDWFEVTQVSMLFGRGRSPRGVEIELTQVS